MHLKVCRWYLNRLLLLTIYLFVQLRKKVVTQAFHDQSYASVMISKSQLIGNSAFLRRKKCKNQLLDNVGMEIQKSTQTIRAKNYNVQVHIPSYIFSSSHQLYERHRIVGLHMVILSILVCVHVLWLPSLIRSANSFWFLHLSFIYVNFCMIIKHW